MEKEGTGEEVLWMWAHASVRSGPWVDPMKCSCYQEHDLGCFLLAFLVVRALWQCPRTSFFLLPINKCAGLKVSQQEKWTPHLEGDFRSVLQHNRTTKDAMIQEKLV